MPRRCPSRPAGRPPTRPGTPSRSTPRSRWPDGPRPPRRRVATDGARRERPRWYRKRRPEGWPAPERGPSTARRHRPFERSTPSWRRRGEPRAPPSIGCRPPGRRGSGPLSMRTLPLQGNGLTWPAAGQEPGLEGTGLALPRVDRPLQLLLVHAGAAGDSHLPGFVVELLAGPTLGPVAPRTLASALRRRHVPHRRTRGQARHHDGSGPPTDFPPPRLSRSSWCGTSPIT